MFYLLVIKSQLVKIKRVVKIRSSGGEQNEKL